MCLYACVFVCVWGEGGRAVVTQARMSIDNSVVGPPALKAVQGVRGERGNWEADSVFSDQETLHRPALSDCWL